MTLANYLKLCSEQKTRSKQVKAIAKHLGVSTSYVYLLASGKRKIPPNLAVSLEIATHSLVPREDSCPHLYK